MYPALLGVPDWLTFVMVVSTGRTRLECLAMVWIRQLAAAAFLLCLWSSYRSRYGGSPLRDRSKGVFEFMPIVYRLLTYVGVPIAGVLLVLGVVGAAMDLVN